MINDKSMKEIEQLMWQYPIMEMAQGGVDNTDIN